MADPSRRDRRPALTRSRRGLERRRVTFGQAEGALLEHPSNDLPALGVRQVLGERNVAGSNGCTETFSGEPDQLEAEVDIPTLSLTYQSLQIGNAAPIRAV